MHRSEISLKRCSWQSNYQCSCRSKISASYFTNRSSITYSHVLIFLQLKDTNLSSLLCVTFSSFSSQAEPGAKNSVLDLVLAVELEPVLLGADLCKDERRAKAFWLHPMYLAVRVVNSPTLLYYVTTSC